MSYQTVLTKTITLKADGVVDIDGLAIQNFSSGNAAYGFRLLVDSVVVLDTGYHTAPTDIVPLGGVYPAAAGQRVVSLRWAADASVTLSFAYLKIRGFNNVVGQ